MLLNFLDDVFLLHFAFKPTQCVFQRLTFLNADFSHLKITVLPMHVAMIAINHEEYYRAKLPLLLIGTHFYRTYPPKSSVVFATQIPVLFNNLRQRLLNFSAHLLE